jgi:HD superfamily phosphodiesterase
MVIEKDNTENSIPVELYNSIFISVREYMNSYTSEEEFVNQNYSLKREHIERVISYSEEIVRSLNPDENSVMIAGLSALLHDIGRFEQFKEYRTFNDSVSLDHAELAVKITEEKGWLNQLPEKVQSLIKKSVRHHNKLALPHNEDAETLRFCKILRDADKIDIIDLTIKEYAQNSKNRNKAFALELKDSISVSKAIIDSLLDSKLPDRKEMKTITDFKLGQLAFVFDMNFKHSFSIVNKRQYLNKLFENLPKNDQIFEIYRKAKIYVENQLIK